MQTAFRDSISNFTGITQNCQRLVRHRLSLYFLTLLPQVETSKIMSIPLVTTEQVTPQLAHPLANSLSVSQR